ncbi:MAG: HDOD domain-containing protein [Desulfobacteraceae bacterium]|nr:HDOD domain-containing protein [Desulfobacteraceae bacterium]
MGDNLVSEKTIAFSIAHEILSSSVDIPTIPENGARIMSMVRRPLDKIDIPSFAKLVESDPGLFTRVLQLANSPFYAEIEKIVSIRSAIVRIGLTEIVNSVCLYFFQKMLPKFPEIPGFSYDGFWTHSWACAVANRRLGHPNIGMGIMPGELYMTGLLQGMGKLMLAIHFPEDFTKCIKNALEYEEPLNKIEKDVFGTTDCLVAGKVMSAWHLPGNICEGVAYYQTPELAPPEYIIIAGLTQYAYAIAGLSGTGCSGDGILMDVTQTYFGEQSNLILSKKSFQDSLIREILNYLDILSDSVTEPAYEVASGKAGKAKTVDWRSKKKTGKLPSKKKKGLMGWIKSFWGS